MLPTNILSLHLKWTYVYGNRATYEEGEISKFGISKFKILEILENLKIRYKHKILKIFTIRHGKNRNYFRKLDKLI